MLTTLIHKPEILPHNIGDDGIPLLSPRLYRSWAVDFPITNTIGGVIQHLNQQCYVNYAVQISPEQIAVKTIVDNTYSASWIDAMFREGVHNMSPKIWRVSKYNGPIIKSDADFILYKNMANHHMTEVDEKYNIIYIIDIMM